jgi:prepilin-type N-terminal cleavage/methylation domain-containing protein
MATLSKRQCFLSRCRGRLLPERDGFTLVEMLVVLGILVIGVLPLAVFQSTARPDVNRSNRYTQAVVLAQEHLEAIKSVGFGNAAPDSGQDGQLQWRSNIQNVAFGLDRITVTVSWNEGPRNRTLQMAGLISMR